MTTIGVFVILIICIAGMYCDHDQCSQGPPPMEKGEMCCKTNMNDQQIECLKRGHEQWELYIKSEDKNNFVKTNEMCSSNCVFNNTNIINPDNKVNPDELKKNMEKMLATEMLPESTKMAEVCIEFINNAKPHEPHGQREVRMGMNSPLNDCNKIAEKLLLCLHWQMMMTCPNSLWTDTPECNDRRDYFKNCTPDKRGHNKQPPSK